MLCMCVENNEQNNIPAGEEQELNLLVIFLTAVEQVPI